MRCAAPLTHQSLSLTHRHSSSPSPSLPVSLSHPSSTGERKRSFLNLSPSPARQQAAGRQHREDAVASDGSELDEESRGKGEEARHLGSLLTSQKFDLRVDFTNRLGSAPVDGRDTDEELQGSTTWQTNRQARPLNSKPGGPRHEPLNPHSRCSRETPASKNMFSWHVSFWHLLAARTTFRYSLQRDAPAIKTPTFLTSTRWVVVRGAHGRSVEHENTSRALTRSSVTSCRMKPSHILL